MSQATCTQCRQPLPADAPGGSCPTCLLRLATTPASGRAEEQLTLDEIRPDAPSSNATVEHTFATSAATGVKAAPAKRLIPISLPNYDLIEELGSGGMGVVYKAWQHGAERYVAVKIIKGGHDIDRDSRERFRIEAKTLGELRHPNFVQIFEVGEISGQPFYSMEFMDGGSLARRIRKKPMSWQESARLVEILARAMQVAHQAGILHRDLKPANVMIADDGSPKITDFGLAKRFDKDEGQTPDGARLGTPSYMAPEQASGKSQSVGPTADVYALGATLYELLAGVPPFRGESSAETAMLVLTTDAPPPSKFRHEVPAELEAICLKCLEKDSTRRYAQASELAEDLARWQRGESTIARPLRWPTKIWRNARKRAGLIAAALLLAISTSITAAVVWTRPGPVEPPPIVEPTPVVQSSEAEKREELRKKLVALQDSLKAGKKTVLIGAKGPPRWYEWEHGMGTIAPSPRNDDVFHFACLHPSCLELLPDPQVDRFRLSADIRLDAKLEEKFNFEVGLYFCYHRYPMPEPHYAGSGLSVVFTERGPPGRVSFSHFSLLHKPGDPLRMPVASDDYATFGSVPLGDRPFRTIIVEVSPEKVEAVWRSAGQPDHRFHALTSASMEAHAKHSQKSVPIMLGKDIALTPPRPRGQLGIRVSRGSVSVRNVIIEPIPQP